MSSGAAGQVLKSMRPRQWTKNVFVLAPLLFAGQLSNPASVAGAGVAFILFCLVAGPVYLLNDVVDRHADANHPVKRLRPVASGSLAPSTALLAAASIAGLAILSALCWNLPVAAVLAAFLGNNLLYSLKGKQIPVLDVLMISVGFILRVVGGALAISVPVSGWILLCTLLLSLYLGLGKRIHEIAVLGRDLARTRPVLQRYDPKSTYVVFLGVGLAAATAFGAYTLSERAVTNFGTRNLVFTVPLVLVGIIRFARLARDASRKRPPTESILTDPVVLAAALGWAAAAVAIIYYPGLVK